MRKSSLTFTLPLVTLPPLLALLACSSSNAASQSQATLPDGAPFAFSGDAGSYGAFACAGPITATPVDGLTVTCPSTSGVIATSLVVPGYHGTGTYSSSNANSADGGIDVSSPILQIDEAGKLVTSAVGRYPGEPVTSCTVDVVGPATLAAGDEVKATVHCTNLTSGPSCGNVGCANSVYVAVDATVDVVVSF
jgi:hypothetical protein